MVELFTAGGFFRSPTDGQVCRVGLLRGSTLPTSARLSEPEGPHPLGRIPALNAWHLLSIAAAVVALARDSGLSPSPHVEREALSDRTRRFAPDP